MKMKKKKKKKSDLAAEMLAMPLLNDVCCSVIIWFVSSDAYVQTELLSHRLFFHKCYQKKSHMVKNNVFMQFLCFHLFCIYSRFCVNW